MFIFVITKKIIMKRIIKYLTNLYHRLVACCIILKSSDEDGEEKAERYYVDNIKL